MHLPLDLTAQQLYMLFFERGIDVKGNQVDAVTRNLCCVALSAVGRLGWDNHQKHLANVRAGIYDWSSPVCCWASLVMWGAISGAVTRTELEGFVRDMNAVNNISGVVKVAEKYLWDGVGGKLGLTQWQDGANMPIGAMVFCGRKDSEAGNNMLYHVVLHVGGGLVVGSCMPVFDNQYGKDKAKEMQQAGLSPFTTIMPLQYVLVKPEWTFYTNAAFWKGWPAVG
jgi:hypothetical protein